MNEQPDIALSPESNEGASMEALGSETTHEFIRYFAASLVALIFDVGILALLTSYFGVEYLISATISFLIGLAVVYIISVRWVFGHRCFVSPILELALFAVVGVGGLVLNDLILWLLTSGLGIFYLFSKLVSIFVVFTWNFVARKTLLFTRH